MAVRSGSRPSGGVYSDIHDTSLTIFRSQGISPITPWVDDHLFARIWTKHLSEYNTSQHQWHSDITSRGGRHQIGGRAWHGEKFLKDGTLEEFVENSRFPLCDLSKSSPRSHHDAQFTYNFTNIDDLSSPLGIPWECQKDLLFNFSTTYIGFTWNLATMQVSLLPNKKLKYLTMIQTWKDTETHSLNEVEKLYGKLLHSCSIIPRGHAFLTKLETMLRLFSSNPFHSLHAPKDLVVVDDLNWWSTVLCQPNLSCTIPRPVTLTDIRVFSDANSGIRIAITIGNCWQAWHLIPSWTSTQNGK